MSQLLFESIRIENGEVFNLNLHQKRVDNSRLELLQLTDRLSLAEAILPLDFPEKGLFKCRVTYTDQIEKVEFLEYETRQPARIRLVENDKISYPHKLADRSEFQEILAQYPDYQEVIITQRGHITDSTWANLAFFDGKNWVTPDTFLLPGTRRQQLIESKILKVKPIRAIDLGRFEKFALINSMRGLELAMPIGLIE